MKKSKLIALSSLITAICVILLVVGEFMTVFALSGAFLAGVVLMIPLAKKSYLSAVLSYIASLLLSLLLSSFRYEAILPFAIFFGPYPIVRAFLEDKKINKIIALILKGVWFIGAILATYYLTTIALGDNQFIKDYILPIMIIGGAVIFIPFDYCMRYFQIQTNKLIERLKL